MARRRGSGVPSPAEIAGRGYNRLTPGGRVVRDLLPVIPSLEQRYQYVVSVGLRDAVTGDLVFRSHVVQSSRSLTRGEILEEAEDAVQGRIGGGNYPLVVWGDYVVESLESTVQWAARRD